MANISFVYTTSNQNDFIRRPFRMDYFSSNCHKNAECANTKKEKIIQIQNNLLFIAFFIRNIVWNASLAYTTILIYLAPRSGNQNLTLWMNHGISPFKEIFSQLKIGLGFNKKSGKHYSIPRYHQSVHKFVKIENHGLSCKHCEC